MKIYFPKRILEPKIMEREEMKVFEDLSKENYKRWIIPFVDEALAGLHSESGRILDVGCGPGLLAKEFAERSKKFQVSGIDISAEAIKLAKRNCGILSNARFSKASVSSLPFPNGAFDLVVCKDSFHHFPNIKKAFVEMKRVLKQNGMLYAQDLRRDLPLYLLRRAIPPDTTLKKLQFYSTRASYTKEELASILSELDIKNFSLATRKLTDANKKKYRRLGVPIDKLREGFQARYTLIIQNK